MLLIAENVKKLISSFGGGEFYLCYLVMILWCFLTPISWFGTPKDFWQAGIVAAVTTSIGALLIAVGVGMVRVCICFALTLVTSAVFRNKFREISLPVSAILRDCYLLEVFVFIFIYGQNLIAQ